MATFPVRVAARSERLPGIDRRRNVGRQPSTRIRPFANTADLPEIFDRITLRRLNDDFEANDQVVAGQALDVMSQMTKQRSVGGAAYHRFKPRQRTGDSLVVGMSKRKGLGNSGIRCRLIIVLEGVKLDSNDLFGRQRRTGTNQLRRHGMTGDRKQQGVYKHDKCKSGADHGDSVRGAAIEN